MNESVASTFPLNVFAQPHPPGVLQLQVGRTPTTYVEVLRWVLVDFLIDCPDADELSERMTAFLFTGPGAYCCLHSWDRAEARTQSAISLMDLDFLLHGGVKTDTAQLHVPAFCTEEAEGIVARFGDRLVEPWTPSERSRLQMYITLTALSGALASLAGVFDGSIPRLQAALHGDEHPLEAHVNLVLWLLGGLSLFLGDGGQPWFDDKGVTPQIDEAVSSMMAYNFSRAEITALYHHGPKLADQGQSENSENSQ